MTTIKYIIICFLFQSCWVPRFSREKSFDYDLHPTVTREVSWGRGGGLSRKGPSRVNEIEKVYGKDGKIMTKTKRKIKYGGCVGKAFYEKSKYYDSNGKVNRIIIINKLDTTTILLNQSRQKTTVENK